MKKGQAVSWAVAIAGDASHGYDQSNRWGPDYDCSSFVITAYKQAGVSLRCTYTGNMKNDMLQSGFADVTGEVNLANGAGMQAGDILLNERNHTAMYVGGGRIVQASRNELGGVTGGQSGDQDGGEIVVRSYYNYPWDMVLRLQESEKAPVNDDEQETYTVKSGDTLWAIAERCLGDGGEYKRLMSMNGLTSLLIYPGQVLKLRETKTATDTVATDSGEAEITCPQRGDTGMAVRALQSLLKMRGMELEVDGDFGLQTEQALQIYQGTKTVTKATWAKLINK